MLIKALTKFPIFRELFRIILPLRTPRLDDLNCYLTINYILKIKNKNKDR